MPRPFKIGVAGCGWIFRERYAPLFEAWPEDVEVVSICDLHAPAREAAQLRFPHAAAFSEVPAMLAQSRLDALFVFTKESANAATATLALRAGIPVFLEKPPAVTYREWEELRAVEETTGVPLYTAFNRRHAPCLIKNPQTSPIEHIMGTFYRKGRDVATFPFTAIHLLDAVACVAGSEYGDVEITFGTPPGQEEDRREHKDSPPRRNHQRWLLLGRLRNNISFLLRFDPHSLGSVENLMLRRGAERESLDFPTDTRFPVPPRARDLGEFMAERTRRYLIELEETDFGRCLRDFLACLGHGNWRDCPHRLARCGSVIRVMELMREAYEKSDQ